MTVSLPTRDIIKAVHKKQFERFGGPIFTADEKKINAALAWPRMMVTAGGGVDVFNVAVSLMVSIVTEKPFARGNHRLGFSLAVMTLRRNGWMLDISNLEALSVMKRLDAGETPEEKLVEFCREKSVPIEH